MATGYTYPVEDGTITEFNDFVLTCAPAFGAFIHQRDEANGASPRMPSLPDLSYYEEGLAKVEALLAEYDTWDDSRWEQEAAESYLRAMDHHWKAVEDGQIKLDRYEAMLAQVRLYQPPTPEHERFKAFMIEQLEESMKFLLPSSVPERQTGSQYRDTMIYMAERDLAYFPEKIQTALDRYAENVAWITTLFLSLGLEPPKAA